MQIGIMVKVLEDLKNLNYRLAQKLKSNEGCFLCVNHTNSIGPLIMHLVLAKVHHLVQTLQGRPWTEKEQNLLGMDEGI